MVPAGSLGVILGSMPAVAPPLSLLTVMYYRLQSRYRMTARELQARA